MTYEQKFRYLWILCSQRTKRQFLELLAEIKKQSKEQGAEKQR